MKDFGSVITSMITPFDENLNIDERKIEFLTKHLADSGTDSVIVGGITGESESLDLDEKLLLSKYVKLYAEKRMKVIASISMQSPDDNFKMVELLDELEYADGLMLSIPYYVGINQREIYEYVETIMEISDLPIFLYNGPIKAGAYIEPDTVIALSRLPNVYGIQEASEDIWSITKIINHSSPDFHIYSGDDRYALPILSIGGSGLVSVISHIKGREVKDMVHSYKRGINEKACHIHQELTSCFDGMYERRPTFIKKILKTNNIDMGATRDLYYNASQEDDMFAKIVFSGMK